MIKVWGRNNSTNVKKVLWCLEELGLPYENIPVGGQFGGNHSEDYLAMNPNGLVPCIHDSDANLTLWESNVIIRYLAAEYGQGSLWEQDPARRAQGEKWMDWSGTELALAFRSVFVGLVRTPPEQRDLQQIEVSKQKCDALMSMLDNALAQHPWLSGEAFGVADIAPAPMVYALLNIEVTWRSLPHVRDWCHRLATRPAFQKIVMIPLS